MKLAKKMRQVKYATALFWNFDLGLHCYCGPLWR